MYSAQAEKPEGRADVADSSGAYCSGRDIRVGQWCAPEQNPLS
jgi:hypothetical protein